MATGNTSPRSRTGRQSTPIDNNYGHLQPQNIELEKAVLGALMLDSYAFSVVSEILKPETFYEKRHQYVYEAILSLSQDERPVDMLTVAEELKRLGHSEAVGGDPYIVELCSNVVSSAHVEEHATILAQKHLARQLINFASQVETKAFDETINVDELMQETEGELFELSRKNLRQDYVPIEPVLAEAVSILQRASANSDGLTGLPTGYAQLDEKTSGWQNSDLVIVAGRPGMGKTSFALSLAKSLGVDNNIPVAIFSMEMNNVQLVNRLMSNTFEIPGDKLLNGQLDPDEWSRLDRNLNKLGRAPIYLDDTPGLSVFEMRTKARRLVREKDVKIIMVDYLQLMNANGMRINNRQEEVSTISRSLKGMAKELNIPIIALSQVNRVLEGREGLEGKRPMLSDLRESGAIEQDADMVLFVHRPEMYKLSEDKNGKDYHGLAEIIIAKHRKGETGIVELRFESQYTRFSELGDAERGAANGNGEWIDSSLSQGSDDSPWPPREPPFEHIRTDHDAPF